MLRPPKPSTTTALGGQNPSKDLGFRVWGIGFRVWGLGFGV